MLVIGGCGQGQREYAQTLFGPQEILMDLHQRIREALEDETALLALLATAEAMPCVVCDEVGCGVVPMDRLDRHYREQVGRACCALAEKAEQVVRMYCGMPTVLKGDGA